MYMEFRVNFTIAKYENDIFSLCEAFNEFNHAFRHFKTPFLPVRTVEFDSNNVEFFHVMLVLSLVCFCTKSVATRHGLPSVQ